MARDKTTRKPLRTMTWTLSSYFAEGLPYMLVRIFSTVFFTDIGVKERYLGYLNFLAWPWNLKFIWSPFLDLFGTKKRWLVAMQYAIATLTAAIAVICVLLSRAGNVHGSTLPAVIAFILVIMAFFAATNDIAIDANYMAGLPDRKDQAAYSGYRILAYRMAMIFVRSGLVALVALLVARMVGLNKYLAWSCAFGAAALTMFLLAFFHHHRLPEFEQSGSKRSSTVWRTFANAFFSYLQQTRIWIVIPFILTYKIGDEILFSMVTPFMLRGLHVTLGQYAWISGIMGAGGAIIGALAGGWWIKRKGLKSAIWPITLFMNLNIWVYIFLAYSKPNPATAVGLITIAVIHGYEQFAAGLGNVALMVYLLGTCKTEFKATHFAFGSAIMTVFATLFGGFGGKIVEAHGYLYLFTLAFFTTIPSMLLLFFVPLATPAHDSTAKNQ